MKRTSAAKFTVLGLVGCALMVLGAALPAPAAADPFGKTDADRADGWCWNPAYTDLSSQWVAKRDLWVREGRTTEEQIGSRTDEKGNIVPVTRTVQAIPSTIVNGVEMAHVVPYIKCGDAPNYRIPARNPPAPWVSIPPVLIVDGRGQRVGDVSSSLMQDRP